MKIVQRYDEVRLKRMVVLLLLATKGGSVKLVVRNQICAFL